MAESTTNASLTRRSLLKLGPRPPPGRRSTFRPLKWLRPKHPSAAGRYVSLTSSIPSPGSILT
jgi:hypothetical protein